MHPRVSVDDLRLEATTHAARSGYDSVVKRIASNVDSRVIADDMSRAAPCICVG